MTDADLSVAAAIIRNIDLLQAAMDYLDNTMETTLGREVAKVIEAKQRDFDWEGEAEDDPGDVSWLAPREWRVAGDDEGNFDLFAKFDERMETDRSWVATVSGVGETGVVFAMESNTLSNHSLNRILGGDTTLTETLREFGFTWEPRGRLSMPITISREALAQAFQDEDFTIALAPVSEALDRIQAARKSLDLLVDRIRERAG